MKNDLTVATPVVEKDEVQRVSIMLPLLDESEDGTPVDQSEHVTINGETTIIMRGVRVDVTVPVFLVLKNKYPNL